MKRLLFAVLVAVLVPLATNAATITFGRTTTYSDGSSIPASKVPTIQYRAYYGASTAGPWTAGATVTDNLAISAPDPAAGSTGWYTVTATLDGVESAKAVPDSKTVPPLTPSPPPGCTVR